jgi:hypothetical protein
MVRVLFLPGGLQGPQERAMRLPASQGFRVRYTPTRGETGRGVAAAEPLGSVSDPQ